MNTQKRENKVESHPHLTLIQSRLSLSSKVFHTHKMLQEMENNKLLCSPKLKWDICTRFYFIAPLGAHYGKECW